MNVIHTSAAFTSEQDAREGLASGADRYIPVPFEPQDLIAAVRAVLH
jgi:DNA-binding response OmpR family regulator